jgi:hypothetical protein
LGAESAIVKTDYKGVSVKVGRGGIGRGEWFKWCW